MVKFNLLKVNKKPLLKLNKLKKLNAVLVKKPNMLGINNGL
jgi:hypothetical protein